MHSLLVHFPHQTQPDQPLLAGVQRIVRQANGSIAVVATSQGALLLAQFCLDGRGLWLQVAAGIRGVHVNGRPVRRMAMLRAGDAVYVDGVEMIVRGVAEAVAQPPAPSQSASGEGALAGSIAVLRGVGGGHHGRSFPLDRPRVIGRDPDADIVIDEPAFAPRHARVERVGERVLLRDLGSAEGTRVNGVNVRHCWLQGGDQLVFDGHHRMVVELPDDPRTQPLHTEDALLPEFRAEDLPDVPRRVRRWPWLLGSALLLAGVLSLLLLFGAR